MINLRILNAIAYRFMISKWSSIILIDEDHIKIT